MTPGRFSFVLLLLACALAAAIHYQGMPWRGTAFPIMGLVISLGISTRHFMDYFDSVELVGTEVQRGKLTSTPSAPGYFWAGQSLSFKEACHHFLVVGATGAGKSITLNLLMQSVFTKFGQPDAKGKPIKRRAVVYDSKVDLVSLLGGLTKGMERIHIMNPLDKRFTPWDISADVRTETDANEFAALLIPKNEKDSSPYFSDTARSLVAGVIKRFIATTQEEEGDDEDGPKLSIKRKPNAWTLRDVIHAFESKEQLRQILDHPETRYLKDHFSKDNAKNFAGVKSTVDSHLALYRPIAALLDASANPPLSLNEWVKSGESILVLGNHELAREATDTLNRLILQQLSKALIAREGVIENDETWIFLDELREAGALKGLRQLLLRGRSKGVSVAMGFQDVEGIFAAYGEHEGAEIIGAAQSAIILHINPSAPKTAQWTSDVFSSRRTEVASNSMNTGERQSWGQQRSAQLVPNVYPIQFVELPMPSDKEGLNFFSFTNNAGYRSFTYPWMEFIEKEGFFRLVNAKEYPDFQLKRSPKAYRLKRWEKDDYERLLVTPVTAAAAAEPTETLLSDPTVLLTESDSHFH